ncbi:MAG: translocation protein TolB [Euryarchaeota archaeon ADurb.BinA087]|nr:MAG: translocation protein TolB [Euryarchaeota archaeon ADurb.BinA087]
MKHMTQVLFIGMIVCLFAMVVPVAALNEGTIAFCSERDGIWEIYTMNPDGSGQVRLTTNTEYDFYPAWSPDGSRIAYMTDWMTGLEGDNVREIYVMKADGTDPVRLTNNTADDLFPAWSPDGSKIAFTSDRDGNYEIYTMNADGTNQTRITSNVGTQPSWSPDGSKIAFISNRDGYVDIYTMNADGTNPIRITNDVYTNSRPSWSPDGSKIVFASSWSGGSGIYLMNADGTNMIPLNVSVWLVYDKQPSWSPDGSKITFTSDRDGNDEIYTMNADGTNPIRLTTTEAREGASAWSCVDSIKVTVPNGGETFYQGSSLPMNWTYTGNLGTKVDIAVIKGGSVVKVLAGIPIGSLGSGSYSVPIPPGTLPANNYQIRVTSASNPAFTDTSDAPFTISGPAITVTAPDGGEIFFLGSSLPMNWIYQGDAGPKVDIAVLKGGVTLKTIPGIPIGTGGSGSYSVLIPAITPLGSDYTIEVTSSSYPACTDTSNGPFTIGVDGSSSITVVAPNGTENWVQGSFRSFQWAYTGSPGSAVNIEVLNGAAVMAVIPGIPIGTAGSGEFPLKVPYSTPVGTNYTIRVTSTSIPAYTDTSDGPFTISSAITVVSTGGGESYAIGSDLPINWTYTGNPGLTVNIDVLKNMTVLKTLTGIPIGPGGSGSLSVPIPAATPLGSDYQIRVTSASFAACTDTSDGFFGISA